MKSLNALGKGTPDELSGAITGQPPGPGIHCLQCSAWLRKPGVLRVAATNLAQLSQEMDSSTPCLDKKATSCGLSAEAQPHTEG